MDASDEQLVKELKGMLGMTGYRTALDDDDAKKDESSEDEGFGDFFAAMSAFRAARASGDKAAEAEAEEHLREVVRAELTH